MPPILQLLTRRRPAPTPKAKAKTSRDARKQASSLLAEAGQLLNKAPKTQAAARFREVVEGHLERLSDLLHNPPPESWAADAVANSAEIDAIKANLNWLKKRGLNALGVLQAPPDVLKMEEIWSDAALDGLRLNGAVPVDRLEAWVSSRQGPDDSLPPMVSRALDRWGAQGSPLLTAVRDLVKRLAKPVLQPLTDAEFDDLLTRSGIASVTAIFRGLAKLNPRSLKDFSDTLARYPTVRQAMLERGVTIEIHRNTPKLRDAGGARLNENEKTVEVEGDIFVNEHFRHYAFHELGHATLQRRLILQGKLPIDVESGDRPPNAGLLTPEGADFYRAWRTLKNADGEFLFATGDIIDLRATDQVAARKGYMTGAFSEFCAESFMQMIVMPLALARHVQDLASMGAPVEVQAAYQTVLGIVSGFAPQRAGPPSSRAAAATASSVPPAAPIGVAAGQEESVAGPVRR